MRINHLIGTIAILLLLTVAPWTSQARDNEMDSLKMFSEVLHLIEDNYVEEKGREELIRGAIEGMLRNLDPHSSYVDMDQLRMMQEDFEGQFTVKALDPATLTEYANLKLQTNYLD